MLTKKQQTIKKQMNKTMQDSAKILSYDEYVGELKKLPLESEGLLQVKAFYNHSIQAFCKDVHALLIALDDHLVHRGDGVFESLTCRDRKIINLDKHLQRLASSLQAIQLNLPMSFEELRALIIQTAQIADFNNGSLRLLIGRGRGGFGVNPNECKEASVYIIASEQKPRDNTFWQKGLTAARSNIPVKQKYLAKIKSTNYLPNVLMALEANEKEVDIVFSFDSNNHLAESAICNLAIYKDNTFYFPTFDNILAGTTVLLAIEKAKLLGNVEIMDITEDFLMAADEILAIGSTIACVGIVEYSKQKVGNGKVGKMALALKDLLLESYFEESIPY